jgi:hypothetical protein
LLLLFCYFRSIPINLKHQNIPKGHQLVRSSIQSWHSGSYSSTLLLMMIDSQFFVLSFCCPSNTQDYPFLTNHKFSLLAHEATDPFF